MNLYNFIWQYFSSSQPLSEMSPALMSQSLEPASPGTMFLSVQASCLLLLIPFLPVSCGRSPSSFQREREIRMGREEHHPLGYIIARKPKADDGKQLAVIDVSDDVDQEPDSSGEYTGASLTRPGMPSDFTICGAFRTEAWTTEEHGTILFQLNGKDGTIWGFVLINAESTYTEYTVTFGNISLLARTSTVWFPLTWTQLCVLLDPRSGMVVLVVDGRVLKEKVQQEGFMEDKNRPSMLSILIGYQRTKWSYVPEYTGQYSNLNVFSRPLPTERLVAMTLAGGEECGAHGDFLSWPDADWKLTSQARIEMVGELAGPCSRESSLIVFTASFKYHGAATNGAKQSGCMEHCQKLGKGRSPPVRTFQEMETLRTELEAVTTNLAALPWLWLSATDQKQEGV